MERIKMLGIFVLLAGMSSASAADLRKCLDAKCVNDYLIANIPEKSTKIYVLNVLDKNGIENSGYKSSVIYAILRNVDTRNGVTSRSIQLQFNFRNDILVNYKVSTLFTGP